MITIWKLNDENSLNNDRLLSQKIKSRPDSLKKLHVHFQSLRITTLHLACKIRLLWILKLLSECMR